MDKKAFEFSVAPMMDWTDRHCRYFHRLIHPTIKLYTEMVVTGAILHGDKERFLRFNHEEQPLALQLGGSDPDELAECAKIATDYGYNEINLNCGCPSDRVQKGAFGACLMANPELVAKCVEKMCKSTNLPITIKCRIGIDDSDSYEFLERFVKLNKDAGCSHFIVHARKAWLKGLSPKENREIPPLDYDRVHQLKKEHPDLFVGLNGGISSLEHIKGHKPDVDGIMIGREAYQNPWFLREILNEYNDFEGSLKNKHEIATIMLNYATKQQKDYGVPLHTVTRHMIGLLQGVPGSKAWRQKLSRVSAEAGNDPAFLEDALPFLKTENL